MIEAEFVESRRLTPEQSLKVLRAAIGSRRPFSFVRMGDGEARLFGAFRDDPDELVASMLKRHWDYGAFERPAIEELRSLLLDAASSADLLGTFDVFDHSPARFQECGVRLRKYAALRAEQQFCRADVHYSWQADDAFAQLFRGVEHVSYISCYDLMDEMRGKFGFRRVTWHPVPGHARQSHALTRPYGQYPTRFLELVEALAEAPAGEVCLVGAGLLGKIYCHLLKRAGAVALDLGSVFDFWADNRRRKSVAAGRSRAGL